MSELSAINWINPAIGFNRSPLQNVAPIDTVQLVATLMPSSQSPHHHFSTFGALTGWVQSSRAPSPSGQYDPSGSCGTRFR